MSHNKILSDPFNQMILEDSFDELVQQIRCQEFMNVGMQKKVSKWLVMCFSGDLEGIWKGNSPQYLSGSQSHPIECLDQSSIGGNQSSHEFVDDFQVDQDWLALNHILMSKVIIRS